MQLGQLMAPTSIVSPGLRSNRHLETRKGEPCRTVWRHAPSISYLCTSIVAGRVPLQTWWCPMTQVFIPTGKYYLADAGSPLCVSLMVPFWGVHYHLTEWGWSDLRWVNPSFSLALRTYNHLGQPIPRSLSIYAMHWPSMWWNKFLGSWNSISRFLCALQSTTSTCKPMSLQPWQHYTIS